MEHGDGGAVVEGQLDGGADRGLIALQDEERAPFSCCSGLEAMAVDDAGAGGERVDAEAHPGQVEAGERRQHRACRPGGRPGAVRPTARPPPASRERRRARDRAVAPRSPGPRRWRRRPPRCPPPSRKAGRTTRAGHGGRGRMPRRAHEPARDVVDRPDGLRPSAAPVPRGPTRRRRPAGRSLTLPGSPRITASSRSRPTASAAPVPAVVVGVSAPLLGPGGTGGVTAS